MDILTFMQYLAESGMSPDNIVNHLTTVRLLTIIYNMRIPLFIKSLKINISFQPKIIFLVDENLLLKIITVAQYVPNSQVFIALYWFCFFFLKVFDSTRHLCVGDVFFQMLGYSHHHMV